jgi:hypothetical protein
MNLLLTCREFFNCPHMKKLPQDNIYHTQEYGAVNFTDKYLLAKIKELYGSLEFFFACFQDTSEGREIVNKGTIIILYP